MEVFKFNNNHNECLYFPRTLMVLLVLTKMCESKSHSNGIVDDCFGKANKWYDDNDIRNNHHYSGR